MQEQVIFLRHGHFTAYQLKRMMRRDINDWVAYAYCSSVETDPTLRERIRVWFIRRFRPKYVDSKTVPPIGYDWVGAAVRALFTAALKPLGVALLIIALTILGLDYIVNVVRPQ